jgi:hypothetical protein
MKQSLNQRQKAAVKRQAAKLQQRNKAEVKRSYVIVNGVVEFV